MSYLLAIAYFLVTSYGLGASLLRFLEESNEPVEKHSMRVGFGIGFFVLLGIFLHLIGITMNWWIFFILALPIPLYDLYKFSTKNKSKKEDKEKSKFKIKKSTMYAIGALIIAAICLLMYTKGAFSYTHLENGDPWHHAMSAKYIAQEKILYTDYPKSFRYMDAYPPGYALIMGMTYQISQEMVWNLKFFNALIITLGIVFFYFLANKLIRDPKTALIATALLAIIPAYFSHFIWAHTLAVTLFFPLFYAALHLKSKRWILPASLTIGALMLTQPTQPIKGLVMLVCLAIAHVLHDKKLWKHYLAVFILGILFSTLWWGAMTLRYDDVMREGLGQRPTTNERWSSSDHFGPLGSATRLYIISDFFSASSQNMITAPVGIGFFPMLLAILGIIAVLMYKKELFKKQWAWLAVLLWTIFTICGLYGGTKLPLALFTFRFWLIVPIPLALLGAKAITYISEKAKGVGIPKIATILILLLICTFTAGAVKWELNTMQWGSENAMIKYQQNDAYEFMRTLPKNTKIFNICHREKFGDTVLIAYDKYACPWCPDERKFREDAYDQKGWTVTPQEVESFAKKKGYEYVFVEGNCIDTLQRNMRDNFDINNQTLAQQSTNNMIQSLANAGLFQPVHQTPGSVVFKVV